MKYLRNISAVFKKTTLGQLSCSLLLAGLLALLAASCTIPAVEPDTTAPSQSDTAGIDGRETVSVPDGTDPYFALENVLDIAIEIPPVDWDALRHQTRNYPELVREIETGCLAQPFTEIFSWFQADVTVDGELYPDVGVRKKGFLGSLDTRKPSLKLRFDKYINDQTLGGVMERMTLNNAIQDDSFIRTCMAFQVFADAGLPAPRCNFATVSVNGKDLGLYVHVEEIKTPFLERHFVNAQGNLYEGTVSDFRPGWSGTFEKKTNEQEDDWSDIEGVVAALQDPTGAGLTALDALVDLDRFLSFWATEALVGHWDGYSGDRNNYHFYREPDGRFVFIPWGVDQVFSLDKDPNPFDNISEPPPSVWAHGAIAHRLYQDDAGRTAYARRLQDLLETIWIETELLRKVEDMAAVVQQHALSSEQARAARDTEEVRQFIQGRRETILEDLLPDPPEWPWRMAPAPCGEKESAIASLPVTDILVPGEIELHFATTWGSNESADPLQEGQVTYFLLDHAQMSGTDMAVIAGKASPEETTAWGFAESVSLIVLSVAPDSSVRGLTLVIPLEHLSSGTVLSIEAGEVGGVFWSIPAGKVIPDDFEFVTQGYLNLLEVGTEPEAMISAEFHGAVTAKAAIPSTDAEDDRPADSTDVRNFGLFINEIAASGDPLDWFELYNASETALALNDFVFADDLTDAKKRTPFPADLVIQPGEYLQVTLDKDGWPGFALGKDEELGIWTSEGLLVDSTDWDEGQSAASTSWARLPDGTGDFQTVSNPTPGAPN